jgi:chromate transporter
MSAARFTPDPQHPAENEARTGSVSEVFLAFLKLGVTSFGGPIAHLGYFHRELIARRRWLDESHYAQLVALCQFLPGPASSQLGFALGLLRAGWPGALAAVVAFTAPSVLLLIAFAQLLPALDHPMGQAGLHGLKILAVAVVAHGVLSMVQKLAPDAARRLIAAVSAGIIVVSGAAAVQLLVIGAGGLLGLLLCRHVSNPTGPALELPHSHRTAFVLLAVFGLLLAATFVPSSLVSPLASVVGAFYRAGALVFGGGHVVLPLLQEAVVEPGWVSEHDFLVGYGAAQAVPGPMFSIAAFLGARLDGAEGGAIGAVTSVVAILLPGLLLVGGALPWWQAITRHPAMASAVAGVNAVVVGLLGAALYDPVWTSAVLSVRDFAIALIALLLLAGARVPLLLVGAGCIVSAMLAASVDGSS